VDWHCGPGTGEKAAAGVAQLLARAQEELGEPLLGARFLYDARQMFAATREIEQAVSAPGTILYVGFCCRVQEMKDSNDCLNVTRSERSSPQTLTTRISNRPWTKPTTSLSRQRRSDVNSLTPWGPNPTDLPRPTSPDCTWKCPAARSL
jgi:hypothetical protein